MNRTRLEQIKAEMTANPAAFQKDGHAYFSEFLPILEKALPKEEKAEVKKEGPKVEIKKEEPRKVVLKAPPRLNFNDDLMACERYLTVEPSVVFAGKIKGKKKKHR